MTIQAVSVSLITVVAIQLYIVLGINVDAHI